MTVPLNLVKFSNNNSIKSGRVALSNQFFSQLQLHA